MLSLPASFWASMEISLSEMGIVGWIGLPNMARSVLSSYSIVAMFHLAEADSSDTIAAGLHQQAERVVLIHLDGGRDDVEIPTLGHQPGKEWEERLRLERLGLQWQRKRNGRAVGEIRFVIDKPIAVRQLRQPASQTVAEKHVGLASHDFALTASSQPKSASTWLTLSSRT